MTCPVRLFGPPVDSFLPQGLMYKILRCCILRKLQNSSLLLFRHFITIDTCYIFLVGKKNAKRSKTPVFLLLSFHLFETCCSFFGGDPGKKITTPNLPAKLVPTNDRFTTLPLGVITYNCIFQGIVKKPTTFAATSIAQAASGGCSPGASPSPPRAAREPEPAASEGPRQRATNASNVRTTKVPGGWWIYHAWNLGIS